MSNPCNSGEKLMFCQCGCNQEVKPNLKWGYIPKFVWGHNLKDTWGHQQSEETKQKLREARRLQKPTFLGKQHTEETKKKMSESAIERWEDPIEIAHQSFLLTGNVKISGSNNYNWAGGSLEPYGQDFTEELKNKIRQRDRYMCVICCVEQKDLVYELHVHHVDYNKLNCCNENLVSLCRKCHASTTAKTKREYWKQYFQEFFQRRMCVQSAW